MQKLADDVEEMLLMISASGFDWVSAIARGELKAHEGSCGSNDQGLDIVAEQIQIVQNVVLRFR